LLGIENGTFGKDSFAAKDSGIALKEASEQCVGDLSGFVCRKSTCLPPDIF